MWVIPEAELKAVKATADPLRVAAALGLHLTRRGRDAHFARCPFHEDKNPSLSISRAQGLWHCLVCGAKGNLFQLVEKVAGVPFRVAVSKVAEWSGEAPPLPEEPADIAPKEEPMYLSSLLSAAFAHMREAFAESEAARRYFGEARGLGAFLEPGRDIEAGFCSADFAKRLDAKTRDGLLRAGLLQAGGAPRFSGCLVYPLRDLEGKIVSLYGRSILAKNGSGRHYYLPGERRGVFGLRVDQGERAYLVESVIDALSLHAVGVPSVLALHGVNGFTADHLSWLKHHGVREILLCLDGDAAGREASARLHQRLKEEGFATHVVDLPDREDPNSFFLTAMPQRTLKDLESLPGFPKPAAPAPSAATLTLLQPATPDGEAVLESASRAGDHAYTVRGLSGHGLDRLRVTVRVAARQNPAAFFIDSLDLYSAKSRAAFIEGAAGELKVKAEDIAGEIRQLITLLEGERLRLREAAEKPDAPKVQPMTDAERKEALALLQSPDLFKMLLQDFESLGVIGEEKVKLLGYLTTVSRFLPRPLGLLTLSRSGAGKTTLQNAICAFVPPEDVVKYSRLSSQALFYKGKNDLTRKVLCVEEEEGMSQAMFSVKLLQSDQRLTLASVRSDPKSGRMKTEDYLVEGPVAILIASTNPKALDFETKNRFLIATIDESEAQTRRILDYRKNLFTKQRAMEGEERAGLLRRWHNAQRLLRPLKVSEELLQYCDFPAEALQDRREWDKYRGLICAIALLRQHQRKTDGDTVAIEAEDVVLANELAMAFFPNSFDEMAPHARKLGEEISKLVKAQGGDMDFDRKALREAASWSNWSVCQALEQLLDLGYVVKTSGQNGVAYRYRMVVDVSEEKRRRLMLTSAEELLRRVKERRKSPGKAA